MSLYQFGSIPIHAHLPTSWYDDTNMCYTHFFGLISQPYIDLKYQIINVYPAVQFT